MIKRKDLLKEAFNADVASPTSTVPAGDRVPSGAVRAMGLSLGKISEDAARVEAFEKQSARGETIQKLDTASVEPSFVEDRLARTADGEFRRLVDSIATTGQQVPILVRPHPEQAGRYQVAYGHRRLGACAELGIPVMAIVRPLSDTELVVAQGKENAERRNLSFIERATFAAHLEQKGFERAVIQSALSVHPAELTRFLAVARSVPAGVISAIGPSPRAGRPRWMELAKHLETRDHHKIINALINQPSFQRSSSDARFDLAMEQLRTASGSEETEQHIIRNRAGVPVIRSEQTSSTLRFTVDLKAAPGIDKYLLTLLPGLLADFEPERI